MNDLDAASTTSQEADATPKMPLRLLLRFADAAYEQRFTSHYIAFYYRYAQVSLILGLILIAGDYLVDLIAYGSVEANHLRATLAAPILLVTLALSFTPAGRRGWQPLMAAFIVTISACLFYTLLRIDEQGGQGLLSWVGILNFTFLEIYCFVILGLQFRYALPCGAAILVAFAYAYWFYADLSVQQAGYGSYHVVTVFLLAGMVGWWREYLLRMEFIARTTLADSRAAAEQRAVLLATFDDVTGLPNRRLFQDLAASPMVRAQSAGQRCAVLHLVVERLSAVYDVYGRNQGDAVLVEMAQRLSQCLRTPESTSEQPHIVARSGDTAFSIFLADLQTQEQAEHWAQRLLACVSQPLRIGAQPQVLYASIGIALFPGDASDLAGLVRASAQAARAAKDSGGDQYQFFDEGLNARARAQALLESELRRAIEGEELRLHFQPQVDVRTGRIVGAEALVRWAHPEQGLILPGRFIALAEESGLIEPLTRWVLASACTHLRRWTDAGLEPPSLSVNLPATCLAHTALPAQLTQLIEAHALPAQTLTLELTESMLVGDVALATDVLSRLRALGFGLSLDDFGTGYSSLNYLQRLPVTELKIDRSFVIDAASGGRDGALATTIVTLGNELGLQVVAEGVETEAQSDFLRGRGCAVQQGYLFSKPVPEDEFVLMLQARHAAL